MRRDAKELPNMEESIKVAKTKPCGMFSPLGLNAGVHRKTNVYMEPSNSDWMAPKSAIFSSAQPNPPI
jgi:hypothetical protein